MQATQTLPPEYQRTIPLNLSKGLPVVILNIVGVLLCAPFLLAFIWITTRLQPKFQISAVFTLGLLESFALLAAVILVMVLHELVHGAFFWLFTHKRPRFGFTGAFAYAAAPDWYLPRNQHIIVSLAPLALISLVGLATIPLLPVGWLPVWLFSLTFNAAGAVGDMTVALWELTRSPRAYIRDTGADFFAHEP